MTSRYAIYYAPPVSHPLHRAASTWLGRDAATGEMLGRKAPPELAGLDLDALTADPAGYGFHATLKAPFELAQAATEADLCAAVENFARARTPFSATIAPAALGDFIAFLIEGDCLPLRALAADCVTAFEPFRAPISDYDIARKRRPGLTPPQDDYLLRFGYPYIFEFFTFHMTLTGRVRDAAQRRAIVAALQRWFEPVSGPHQFSALTLFKQEDRKSPFVHLRQALFAA